MISPETFPQNVKDAITGVEFPYHPINKAMVVSFKNGLDVSVVIGPMTFGGYEIAVGIVDLGVWETCPLTNEEGLAPDLDGEGVIDFLSQVADFSTEGVEAGKLEIERAEVAILVTATQFGILRLAGLGADDDPYEYINGTDADREALGLHPAARKALSNVDDLHLSALDRVTPKAETENDSE